MDSTEPDQTPFAAVSAQSSKLARVCHLLTRQSCLRDAKLGLDISVISRQKHPLHNLPLDRHSRPPVTLHGPHPPSPRMVHRHDRLQSTTWSSLTYPVCYTLGIYLLNQFLAFLQPKFDPSLTQDEGLEDGTDAAALPTKQDQEFRPFIRRLPEFKFWHSSTRATALAFMCTWFSIFDVPVFWPVLLLYFIILFSLTSQSLEI